MANATATRPVKSGETTKEPVDIRLRPTGDKILVRRLKADEMTPGGIILPDSAQKKPGRGVAEKVGPKVTDDSIKDGAAVYFGPYAGNKVEIPGLEKEEFLLMREEDILAVVE